MSLVPADMNETTPDTTSAIVGKSDKSKVAELRDGKVIFKQKPMSFENHSETMQEIVTFRGYLETTQTPLLAIPDEYLPLIAKLVHESDKTLTALAKSLQSSLVAPTLELSQDSETAVPSNKLPTSAIEHAIKAVADRTNYGITTGTYRPPAALCVWRWEVKNADWLPKAVSQRAVARLNERIAAKKCLHATFDNLSSNVKEAILKTKPSKATIGTELDVSANIVAKEPSQLLITDQGRIDSQSNPRRASRLNRPLDAETVAKEKEKQDKKVVKSEKAKKVTEATKRSAAVFANFFKPAGQSSISPLGHDESTAQASSSKSTPTPAIMNEFNASFKPFVLKKDSQLAPINWFADTRKKFHSCRNECMVTVPGLHGQEVQMTEGRHVSVSMSAQSDGVMNLGPKEMLRSFLNSKPLALSLVPRRLSTGRPFKSKPTHCVREIMDQLIEAEVQGDQRSVRRLAGLLKNRRKIPAKVFVFAENNRPGYLGTWTRSSSVIDPRTPFARDLLSFDYDHDSDAEWEQEEGNSGEDVESHDESLEDDVSSVGSDMDGWLVEADEINVESKNDQDVSSPASTVNKRKTADSYESINKKRKVVPLIPFQKGPLWEKEIGHCEYQPFRSMSIQLFNDTSVPINPFTFVCEPVIFDRKKEMETVFAVPDLPGHRLPTGQGVPESSAEDKRSTKRKSLNYQPLPKTNFPDAHVPILLHKIKESTTSSFPVLLDSLFQDIKSLGVKKNALAVKLREVAEKSKVTKSWVVKEDAWTRHGLMKPR